MKEVLGLALIILLVSWNSFRDFGQRDYEIRQNNVSNIVYNFTQVAAKRGTLYESAYDDLEKQLERYGDFEILLRAEKHQADGTTHALENESVVNFDLRKNEYDLITIYVVDKKDLFLNRVYGAYPMNIETNYKVVSQSCSYIE